MIDPELSFLWNRFYDPVVLERLDLSNEWGYVKAHEGHTLSTVFKKWTPHLSEKELEDILISYKTLTNYLEEFYEEDMSLFIFNMLPLVKHYIKKGQTDVFDKLLYSLKNMINFKWRGIPSKVIIELTNNCNLNCVMCGIGSVRYSPIKTMPLDMFSRIINEIAGTVKTVRLNGLGESTIIPNFLDYLSIIKSYNIQSELVTNFSIDNGNIINELLETNANLLISCDSPNLDHLAAIRRGLDVNRFVKNLSILRDYQHRDPKQNQFIFTIMEDNFMELPEMINFAACYNFGGVIGNMVKDKNGSWKINKFEKIIEIFKKASIIAEQADIELKLPNQIEGVPIKEDFVNQTNCSNCATFIDEVFIRYNGDICPCNMMNPYIYGNIRKKKIEEILNGIHVKIFTSLINTEYKHPYCEYCYYLQDKSEKGGELNV